MRQHLHNVLKHSSIYSLGEILKKIIGFCMIPIYTRVLTTEDYGVLEIITLVMVLLSLVLSLRLTSGVTRFYHELESPAERDRLVSSGTLLIAAAAAVFAVVLTSASQWFSTTFFHGDPAYASFFRLAFLAMGFEMAATMCFTYLRVIEKSVLFIVLSVLQLAIGLGLNIVLLVWMDQGIAGILISMVWSNAIVALVLVAYTLSRTGLHVDPSMLRRIIGFSLPLIPAGIFIFILNMGDRFLLQRMTDESQVGIYGLGYKFGMLIGTFIGTPFLTAWSPKRIEIYRTSPEWREINSRIATYITLVLVTCGLGIAVFIDEAFVVLVEPDYYPAADIVPWVVLGYIFYTLYYIFDFGIFVSNRTGCYVKINALAAVLNIALNVALIPWLGILGAAIVTAATFLLCPVLALIASQRLLPARYDYGRLAQIFLLAVPIYWLSRRFHSGHVGVDIAVEGLLLLAYPGLLAVTGFFDREELAFLRRKLGWSAT